MAFVAGQFLTAALLNDTFRPSNEDTQNTTGTTASTTFTATLTGGTACGVSFVAPLSGVVEVCNSGFVGNSGVGRSYLGFSLKTGSTVGSGVAVVPVSDENSVALQAAASNNISAGRSILVSGLTPGANYNVQQLFKVSSGTGPFAWKRLSVYAAPA